MINLEITCNWCHIIKRMPGKTIVVVAIAALTLASLGLVPVGAAPLGFSTGIRSSGGLQLTGYEPFPVKAQATASAGPWVEGQINHRLGVGLAVQAHGVAPSNLSGGFQYRGYWGIDLRPYLGVRWLEHSASDALELVAGNLVGVILRYDGYFQTYRYFFYMGLTAEPYLELHFRQGSGRHSLVASLPLDLYFRRDLTLSAGAGLAVAWKMYFPETARGAGP
jgi:hypothetical protein